MGDGQPGRVDASVVIDDPTALVARIRESRAAGSPAVELPSELDRSAALDLQLAVADSFVDRGDAIAGWKVAFTSGPNRDRMGAGYRPFGYILGGRVYRTKSRVPLPNVSRLVIEPELCFRMAATLSGSASREQVLEAIGSVHPAFELNNPRSSSGSSDATVIADGMGNWGLVVGPGSEAVDVDASRSTVELRCDGEIVATATPPVSIDDPIDSIVGVVGLLGRHGRMLESGQFVITGAFAKAEVTGDSSWRAEFSNLGEVEIAFSSMH